jgi:hypothetical protein
MAGCMGNETFPIAKFTTWISFLSSRCVKMICASLMADGSLFSKWDDRFGAMILIVKLVQVRYKNKNGEN